MVIRPSLVVALAFAGAACSQSDGGATGSAASAQPSAALLPSPSPSARASAPPVAVLAAPKELEIRACAPLDKGEIRLLDVHPHAAVRIIALARRTPIVAVGMPRTGCRERCRGLSLRGSAEDDLAAVGFGLRRLGGVIVAAPEPPRARTLVDGGQHVDFERERARLSDVIDLLADSQRLAHAPPVKGEITVVARDVPGLRLLDAVAAATGGTFHRAGKQLLLDGVVAPALDRIELASCAAPACPVVTARCTDARKLRLVAVVRRPASAPPLPANPDGTERSDAAAYLEDETGFAWLVRVGDHVGRDEPSSGKAGEGTETRRVEAITCGTVTLDDGFTITPPDRG